MNVRSLLSETEYTLLAGSLDIDIEDVVLDSRQARRNTAFVAMIGQLTDGHRYIAKAAELGASLILIDDRRRAEVEEEVMKLASQYDVTVVSVPNCRNAYADMAATCFGHPSENMKIIGITGTKGKTTSTYILHEILNRSGRNCGLIGSVENKIGDLAERSKHTTPEAWEFQKLLSRMRQENVQHCVMEVSSLGLKFQRTRGVNFAVGVFTNFLNDHVSEGEHETEEDYFLSKLSLFDHCEIALVNRNSRRVDEILKYAGEKTKKCYTYSVSGEADFYVKKMAPIEQAGVPGMTFTFVCPEYETEIFVPLLCDFNVDNALCAAATAYLCGVSKEEIREGMTYAKIPGRMEKIDNQLGLRVYVDYAHNGDSLEVLLHALRPACKGRLITVFGCGGHRPPERRYSMGEVSARCSDYTIVTTDNSRDESFESISGMILDGFRRVKDADYCVIEDRRAAIAQAVEMATPEDIVVIAGKGHELTMEMQGQYVRFVDAEETSSALKELEGRRKAEHQG